MPTLAVGMRFTDIFYNMLTASVSMAPINFELTKHY
jgi:hypothetical protein